MFVFSYSLGRRLTFFSYSTETKLDGLGTGGLIYRRRERADTHNLMKSAGSRLKSNRDDPLGNRPVSTI